MPRAAVRGVMVMVGFARLPGLIFVNVSVGMKASTSHLLPLLSACACALLAACSGGSGTPDAAEAEAGATAGEGPAYPQTARGDVADDDHGTKVADPYRWLEALDSEETNQWVAAENKVTQPILEKLPNRAWLKDRLTALGSYERFGVAQKAGTNYYYTRNDGKQNQSVLYVSNDLGTLGTPLFDPNEATKDATIALSGG